MFRLILLSFIVFSTAVGSELPRQVDYQADSFVPLNITPTFDNGHLVVYGGSGPSVYSTDGSLAFTISNPANGAIPNVAVDKDRTAAAAVHYGLPTGEAGGITIYDRTGKLLRSIDTARYLPSFVCFGPDHTIWSTGRLVRDDLGDQPEYFILPHFSQDGKDLGGFLPRSSFDREGDPSMDIVGVSGLLIANNRMGTWLDFGGQRGKGLWLETDLNGKELGRWRTDGVPRAFRSNGDVYTSTEGRIYVLDRLAGKWNLLSLPLDGVLLGSDGASLVCIIRGTNSLRWVSADPN
jgi:hypothetical protein